MAAPAFLKLKGNSVSEGRNQDSVRLCKAGCGSIVSKVGRTCDECSKMKPGPKHPCDMCGNLIPKSLKRCDKHWLEAKNGSRAAVRPRISRELRIQVLLRDKLTCVACGLNVKSLDQARGVLVLDHIVSHVSGGPTSLENLQTMCAKCNRAKWLWN